MPDKIFIGSQFKLIHRNAPRIRWDIEAQPDFVFVFLVEGIASLRTETEEKVFTPSSVLVLNSGTRANIAGTSLETITLRVSPAYVLDCAVRSKLVKHDAQITFRLDLIKISRAQTLLAETDFSITQIASRVGYSSSSHSQKPFVNQQD